MREKILGSERFELTPEQEKNILEKRAKLLEPEIKEKK